MFRNRKTNGRSWTDIEFDQLALCAGQMYFIALALADDEQFAASLTRDSFDRLLTSRRTVDDWLTRWARRITIKACIHRNGPELHSEAFTSQFWENSVEHLVEYPVQYNCEISAESVQRGVRSLPLLPRFVFITRVLERYSSVDTALLLEIDSKICEAALAYALAALTRTIHSSDLHAWLDDHCCA